MTDWISFFELKKINPSDVWVFRDYFKSVQKSSNDVFQISFLKLEAKAPDGFTFMLVFKN